MARNIQFATATRRNALYEDGRTIGLKFPTNRVEFAVDGRQVSWLLSIRGVGFDAGVGGTAPTGWTLDARFLDINENINGPQYGAPEEVPFSELQTRAYVREGIGWCKPSQTLTLPNPAYSPRELVANPAFDARATIEQAGTQVPNPAFDPRGTIANPAFDAREALPNPAVPRSAGEWGRIADSTDGLGGSTYAHLTRTVETFHLRHRLQLRVQFTGGQPANHAGAPFLYWTCAAVVTD